MPRDGLMMNNLQWVSEICEKIILKIMQWLLDFVDLTMYRIIFIPNNFCWIYFINEDKSNYTNVTLNPSLVVGVVIISVLGGNVGTSFFNMYLCYLIPWFHRHLRRSLLDSIVVHSPATIGNHMLEDVVTGITNHSILWS